jgi:hypothetical protein
MPASLPQRTVVSTTESGTEPKTETETGTVTVTVTIRSETSETGTETEMSGTDVPSFLAAPTDEAMLRDLLLSFATTSPRMLTITCPLPAATIPTTGVALSVPGRSTTGQSRLPLTTEGLHSTTVVHLYRPLLLMTVVSLWMIAR